jgi:group I intron endonuclease
LTQVIYKIVNLVNDKFYVGSTIHKKVRFRQHRKLLRGNRHHCKHLQAAWNKYGEEKFDFRVVEEVPDAVSLQGVEDRWLKEHVGQTYCYNTGHSSAAPWRNAPAYKTPNFGKTVSEEQRQQISQTLKDFYAQDYFNHPRVGKQHTEETKAKISVAKMANPVAPWEGRQRSEETKAKIGDTQRGKPKGPGRKVSEEGRAKIRANIEAGRSHMHWLGRTHTEEAKEKMRKKVLEQTSGQIFDSLTAVLTHYQMTMPTLRRALLSGKPIGKGKFTGLVFVYA